MLCVYQYVARGWSCVCIINGFELIFEWVINLNLNLECSHKFIDYKSSEEFEVM